jgi:phosphoribosylformylglycinamidine synthase
VIGTIGLIKDKTHITNNVPNSGNRLFILGHTREELGGSEYFELIDREKYGRVPKVNLNTDKKNRSAVLDMIEKGLIEFVHDCSKGGIGTALSELAIFGNTGINIDLKNIPNTCTRNDFLLFSETHSRYIIGTNNPDELKKFMRNRKCKFSEIGGTDSTMTLRIHESGKEVINLPLKELANRYNTMNNTMDGI